MQPPAFKYPAAASVAAQRIFADPDKKVLPSTRVLLSFFLRLRRYGGVGKMKMEGETRIPSLT